MNAGQQQTTGERVGYIRVCCHAGDYFIRRNELEQLQSVLIAHRLGQSSLQWYEAEDNYGDMVMIDLAKVEAIVDCSPAGIAAAREDERIKKMRGED
jgi:hypothetical protein